MGKIKEAMLQWMEDENLTPEDLDNMDDINEKFEEWIGKHLTPEQDE
jgi:hypothetical protein